MVEMSHTRNALVFDIRDQWTDDWAALTEQSGRRVKTIITCQRVTIYREFGTFSFYMARLATKSWKTSQTIVLKKNTKKNKNMRPNYRERGVGTDKQSSTECVYEIL